MLLTISTTHDPAADFGYLLHKHPERFQSFDLSFGRAHVFYPEMKQDRATVALLLDIDPVGAVRGKGGSFLLGNYVNDRPYVACSYLSVAIAQVFGTALAGRSKERPEATAKPIPLSARIEVLPVRGDPDFLRRVFEPLAYAVEAVRHPLDTAFSEWGESPYYSVAISGTKTLAELLAHLYVLVPVFDNAKHYYVGDDEMEKLLDKGSGWLADHPEKEQITRRYLRYRSSLYREALARLAEEEADDDDPAEESNFRDEAENSLERPLSLHEQRHGVVLATLRACGARSVVDLGCGGGKFVRQLLADPQFERIVGLDVSAQTLQRAAERLGYDRLPPKQKERLQLLHGSLIYRDERIVGFDAAVVIEVIEHLDPPRLRAFERVLFEFARPKNVLVTTPNREYNRMWETLPAGEFRHPDHRFEWTREEFRTWAAGMAKRHGYRVRYLPIGPEDAAVGSPTQMGVFEYNPT